MPSRSSRRKTAATSSGRTGARRSTAARGRRTKAIERVLVDHNQIRQWAEERGAIPVRVKGTGGKDDVGILRLHFPAYSEDDSALEPISWDEWFREFEKQNLVLIVEEKTASGRKSNFNKLVGRDRVFGAKKRSGSARGGSASGSRRKAA
ncbi:MAG TPA: hypothetical protein VGP65_18725 [Candidatus Angelobacter sp.]|nr:hypothetical protein [Candidatus Angelobacter sp.]